MQIFFCFLLLRISDRAILIQLSGYLNPDIWIQISESGYLNPDIWIRISETGYLKPDIWNRISETGYLNPDIWIRISESGYGYLNPVSDIQQPDPVIEIRICIKNPVFLTKNRLFFSFQNSGPVFRLNPDPAIISGF